VTYAEAVAWLYRAQWHGIKLGLENMRRLVAALGVDLSGAATPRFLHVAGTNGKGSVCAMLDSICRAAGRRTGLFTSPHLISFRERIRVAGEPISERAVAEGLTEIRALIAGWEPAPTFFEIATALALAHFCREGVEIAVWETGLGGRLDATNVVTPIVSIITPIDLDHQQWLGETLSEIALEKAGIIKTGVPAVSAPQKEAAESVLAHVAVERGTELHLVVSPLGNMAIGLAGAHQRWNAALAVHALDVAGLAPGDAALARGLADVQWPGRFQTIGDCILDGAHNPAAARRLAEAWRGLHGEERATLVMGAVSDKDLAGICAELAPLAARAVAVPVRSPRSVPAEDVRAALRQAAPTLECRLAADAREAIRYGLAHPEKTLVAGSLFLVGEALAYLTGQPLGEESAQ
jgi:dihydrofolate synthase/folylpolyglutamate synthase